MKTLQTKITKKNKTQAGSLNKIESSYKYKSSPGENNFSIDYSTTYTLKDLPGILKNLDPMTVKNRKISYINISAAFDIETTSFYYEGEKQALMYIWQFGINGKVITGRQWGEFLECCKLLTEHFKLNAENRLIIYVHNLAFEFSFIMKLFEWENVFCLRKHKPIYALTTSGIEFRCSYILSNFSLETVGNNLLTYKVRKLSGSLNYDLLRHPETILYKKELQYCINDVLVVMSYIQEKIESEGNIDRIKLTNTGYVRQHCKNACYKDDKKSYKYIRYRSFIMSLLMTPDLYKYSIRAFMGGFVHGSSKYMFDILYHLGGVDFSSSYPAVMVLFKYPTGIPKFFKNPTNEEFLKMIKNYCCIFDIRFTNLRPKIKEEQYLSLSKCYKCNNVVSNNGRIVSADSLITTITEVDFNIINEFYEYDSFEIGGLYRFYKQYLPTDLIKAVLELYEGKTTLKGIEVKELEYMNKKGMLNSTYGMMVTNIIQNLVTYDTEWKEEAPDLNEAIEKYNNSKNRFLYYPWGIYVTAYARRNLLIGLGENTFCIKNCIEDYVYSDTDSIKFKHPDKYIDMINNYNSMIEYYTKEACKYHKIDIEKTRPKTKKGIEKPLGVWDIEAGIDKPDYAIFKTLGAKRYMYMQDGKISMTVSGVNKKTALPYLINKFGRYGIFENFNDDLYIPKGKAGKLTHTYIEEEPMIGTLEDYQGNVYNYQEESGTHLEAADYDFSISPEFKKYILGVKEFLR